MRYILQKGFKSINGQIEILDSDSLCYLVKNNSKGISGIRTISKALLEEYVDYFEKHPHNTSQQARDDLTARLPLINLSTATHLLLLQWQEWLLETN